MPVSRMTAFASRLARHWLPPALRHALNRMAGQTFHYSGRFDTWQEACRAADGYDDKRIIERIHSAALTVREGRAAWEQDGESHPEIILNFPVLACLAKATRKDDTLRVLDIGGGFGSSWLQASQGMPDIKLHWTIVEQERVVSLARQDFNNQGVRYTHSLDEALATNEYDLALLSSVLQYIATPHAILDQLASSEIKWIVIDRHPCSNAGEVITIQHCPRRLYKATYPSWLFDCESLRSKLNLTHDLALSWQGQDQPIQGDGFHASFAGMCWKRRGEHT